MDAFDSFVMSRHDGPAKVAVYSLQGWGKTTLFSHMPDPAIIGAESGVIPRDLPFAVPVATPRSWLDVFDLVEKLRVGNHGFRSLAFDTLDWLEPLIHRFIFARDSGRKTDANPRGNEIIGIEDYPYGKGWVFAEEEFRKLISVVDVLQAERGMHVFFLAHCKVANFKNPTGADFDRYEMKCHARIASVIKEWCEHLLFGHYRFDAAKNTSDVEKNEKAARTKAVGDGQRMIGARQSPVYDAKNRAGLEAEFEYDQPVPLLRRLINADLAPPMTLKRSSFDDAPARPREMPQTTAMHAPSAMRFGDAPPKTLKDEDPGHYRSAEQQTITRDPPPREQQMITRDLPAQREQPRTEPAFSQVKKPTADPNISAPGPWGESPSRAAAPPPQRESAPPPIAKSEPTTGAPANGASNQGGRDYYYAALKLLQDRGDDTYKAKAQIWIDRAGGDAPKLDAIARKIHAELGTVNNHQGA